MESSFLSWQILASNVTQDSKLTNNLFWSKWDLSFHEESLWPVLGMDGCEGG